MPMRIVGLIVGLLICFAVAWLSPVNGAPVQSNAGGVMYVARGGGGHGSGVHIGGGLVLTAAHVVNGASTFEVSDINGAHSPATVLWSDSRRDVALLSSEYSGPLSSLACREGIAGEDIRVSGNPQEISFVTFQGRVVASGQRSVGSWWPEALLVDVTAGPGNSGGPVFDEEGKVLGLLVGGPPLNAIVHGLYFVVPASSICRIMGSWR